MHNLLSKIINPGRIDGTLNWYISSKETYLLGSESSPSHPAPIRPFLGKTVETVIMFESKTAGHAASSLLSHMAGIY